MDTSDSAQLVGGLSVEGPMGLPLRIFINYRHEDMPFAASTLYRELKGRFGKENIFFDGGTLRPGMRFLEEIKSHLAGTPGAFMAVIGSRWMPTMDAHRRRGDEDYVAKEIELALQNRWTIIPVLVNEASLPDPSKLPPAIRALPDCQVAHLRQTSLDDDVEDLSARLDEIRVGMNNEAGVPEEADVPDEAVVPVEAGAQVAGVPVRTVTEPPDEVDRARVPPPDVFPADDEHYQTLVDEADNLVIFLGAGVNADDHEGPFRAGASMLPDDTDLAEYLAAKARLKSGERELAEVAQYASMIRGEPNMFKWVNQILRVDSVPGPVHTYLARLPRRLEELGLGKRYQMIVTPKFDVALERAFRKEGEPFDVAVYMAPGTEYAGKFVHLPWGSVDPQPVVIPNEYDLFPIVDEGELTKTVIVRINGAVDDITAGYRWKSNFVITEDHYIDYLGGRSAEEVVPIQLLAKLRQASCLFLGYTIADWRLRVFLHWIWRGERPSRATHWAVERNPGALERQFWQLSGVCLYRSRLTDYVQGFDTFLNEHSDELT
jgi:hypothetical protein